MFVQSLIVFLLFILAVPASAEGKPEAGSCVGFEFQTYQDDETKIDYIVPLRVICDNAKVFGDANGTREVKHVSYGEVLRATRVSNSRSKGRIEVTGFGSNSPLGWMERDDLLCYNRPLKGPDGLERKVFIRTPPSPGGKSGIPAYSSPAGTSTSDTVRNLSRFQLYFVFAEDNKTARYLLARDYSLTTDSVLTGWVDKNNGIEWNSTYAIRPADDVDRTYIYKSKEAAQSRLRTDACPVVGNRDNRWYKYISRIPILSLEEYGGKEYYKVAAPTIGVDTAVNPFETLQLDKVLQLKDVDVFFLIDATKSMEPYIQGVLDTARFIARNLSKQPGWRETTFRYGFLVFRDTYAASSRTCSGEKCSGCDDRGVCEGLALSDSASAGTNGINTFEELLAKVRTTDEVTDDYPEALFDGIRQALRDIAPCPDHVKMLFVIGDCGGKEEKVPSDIISCMNRFDRICPIFIQTNNLADDPNTNISYPEDYRSSYNMFSNHALQVLRGVLAREVRGEKEQRSITPEEFMISLDEITESSTKDLVQKATHRVSDYSNSTNANELIDALHSGQALLEYVDNKMVEGDLPILYLNWIANLCDEFPQQCRERVSHRVDEGYVDASEQWTEEMWIQSTDLDSWMGILRRIEGISTTSEVRDALISALTVGIQESVGLPPWPDARKAGESLEEYIRRRGGALPIRKKSPLMQYSYEDLTEVQECELYRLVNWSKSIYRVLASVNADPTMKANFTLRVENPTTCPNMSRKGRKIPRLLKGEKEKLGRDNNYSYDHESEGIVIYWLPKEFLP